MGRHVLVVLAYVAATFATQATSHFFINAEHYAAVAYIKKDPIFALGFTSMLVQGGVFAWLFARASGIPRSIGGAVGFSWAVGAVLVSYIALAEAAKYAVPSVPQWIAIEMATGFVQFTVFGILLGLIYRPSPSRN